MKTLSWRQSQQRTAQGSLGGILHELGRNREAEAILREAFEYERRLNGIDQALAFSTTDFLGATLAAA